MNISRWLIAIAILIAIIASLGFVKVQQIQAAIAFGESFPEPSASVQTARAEMVDYSPATKVMGQLTATESLMITNEFAGKIINVNFQPGELVEANQVLLQLDISSETANLAAAKARLKLAKTSYERQAKLLAQKRISEEQVDQAEADKSIAQAEVDNLQSVINKKTIKAPFRGRIGLTQYQEGQFLTANSELTSLIGVANDIWVDFMLPQTLPQLAINDAVQVKVIQSNASDNKGNNALIIARNAAVNSDSRQVKYRAVLSNHSQQLQHNQIVSVTVLQPSANVVVVPSSAVTRNHLGEFVFVLKQDEQNNYRAHSVKVALGARLAEQQVITAGIEAGALVATEGAFKLSEQLLVYPAEQVSQQAAL